MSHAATAPLNKPVFYISAGILSIVIAACALVPETASRLLNNLQATIFENTSWYYVLVVAAMLGVCLFLAFSRYGDVRLGRDDEAPEYSGISWFAMLFAAGMGIGLMFFGVAEPVTHFMNPPEQAGGTLEAAKAALPLTFFHWGLHAWATYVIVAAILAYFSFRKGLPLTLRSALYPLAGDRIHGALGDTVDIFAIVCTTFGVAASLGFGVEQINAGLNYLFDIPKTGSVQTILIVGICALATTSVILGLDAGIKRLSQLNMVLAVALLVLVLLLGPTLFLLEAYLQNIGVYLAQLIPRTFTLYAYEPNPWLGSWTIFYWGWWISWAPFVGLFIARISRGRTLRQFIVGALLVPSAFTFLWMTVFGNTAIELILNKEATSLAQAVSNEVPVALFVFLEHFPLTQVLSVLGIVMVVIFFVTSADSGALVLNMLSSNGSDNTPIVRRVIWVAGIGLAALVLLLAGGLGALQTAAVASALPFSMIVLVAMWGLLRALRQDLSRS